MEGERGARHEYYNTHSNYRQKLYLGVSREESTSVYIKVFALL